MFIVTKTGKPYEIPAVFEIEIQEMIERAEDEVWWANYRLDVARKVAEQLRERKRRT